MNIVKEFTANFQGEDIQVSIEKITKGKFIGRSKIVMGRKSIDYNQSGNSIEEVEKKVRNFFGNIQIKEMIDASNGI